MSLFPKSMNGIEPKAFQKAYAQMANIWVDRGLAAEFEQGPPESFFRETENLAREIQAQESK